MIFGSQRSCVEKFGGISGNASEGEGRSLSTDTLVLPAYLRFARSSNSTIKRGYRRVKPIRAGRGRGGKSVVLKKRGNEIWGTKVRQF